MKSKCLLCQLLLGWVLGSVSISVQAATIQQGVVSIPPLKSLVQPLLPKTNWQVLLKPGQEPHTFQLKPSQRWAIAKAQAVFGVGTEADLWLQKAVQSKPSQQVIWMTQVPNLIRYPTRGKHSHNEHEHEHEHEHGGMDPHIWLAPENVLGFVALVGQKWQLPDETVQAWQVQIQQADQQVKKMLTPVKQVPFVVMHDAFQYFERHYGLHNVGVIQLNPSLKPSIRHVLEIRQRIQQQGVRCVFKEPQFPERQLRAVVQGLNVKVMSVDPLNTQDLPYDQFLIQLGKQFQQCLQSKRFNF